jgi:hypothetical protein
VESYDSDTQIYHIIPSWRVAGDGESEKVHAYLNAETVMKETKVKEEVTIITMTLHSFHLHSTHSCVVLLL